ncbi:PMS1 protein homolog 1 isoform X7 [Ambystoma mexicanum]|uniref:PMS1 protein homolog 1 isoform X7 n=1 Tax=Ambystoma mexicanum TaxID=8296 RepID=UPI0037E7857F
MDCTVLISEDSKMQQLPPSTVRLLSSSQVITSVMNVVKELMENAIDANATSIDIKLENYGFDKIEIRDNGDGIKAVDTPVMAVQHYTSKITNHEDLESLVTYGFRGEALGSICTLAEVYITTKTADDDLSTQYTLDRSGHITSQKPSHLGQGTTVTVAKLFKNLPVRKQFYSTSKKCKDELKRIQDLLIAYGIIKPEVRIIFTHNKAVIWQKTRVSDHKTAFMSVLGTAIMSSMVPFQHNSEDPELIRHYYHLKFDKDSPRSYPVFFISIMLPASTIDVNVTPDKTQVMMHNKESVLIAMETVLTSLYGPLPATVSNGSDKADVTCTDTLVNIAEQTDVLVNEIEPSGKDSPKTHTSSFSFSNDVQNSQAGKNTEACFKHQILFCDNPRGPLNKKDTPDINAAESDVFLESSVADTSSCSDNQSRHGVSFAIDELAVMESQSQFTNQCPQGDAQINLLQRTDEAQAVPKHTSEICADSWSMGSALKNSSGDNLEPVKLLIPGVENTVNLQASNTTGEMQSLVEKDSKSMSQKLSNVINKKSAQITPYDLISNRAVRKPMSASDIFMQEYRGRVLADNPKACMEDITLTSKELWKTFSEDERGKYEEKAAEDLDRYIFQTKKASEQSTLGTPRPVEKRHRLSCAPKTRLNGPLSNQQILDTLFQSQREQKPKSYPVKIVDVPFTLSSLKQRLQKLSEKCDSDVEDLILINKLSSPGAWIVASEKKVLLLNPYRVEEALLFKRLMENHKIPVEPLDTSILLTERLVGGLHHMDALYSMEKERPGLNGWTYISDPRLVTNGFKIKLVQGAAISENQIEIEAMAEILPYYGLSDLKEILHAVVNKNAKKACECRPLKVRNYLQGEAVRLSRQLPLYLSNEDVQDTISRMRQQLADENKACVHGRPFFHHLTDIPEAK